MTDQVRIHDFFRVEPTLGNLRYTTSAKRASSHAWVFGPILGPLVECWGGAPDGTHREKPQEDLTIYYILETLKIGSS